MKKEKYEVIFNNISCYIILIFHYIYIISFITEVDQKNQIYDYFMNYFQTAL